MKHPSRSQSEPAVKAVVFVSGSGTNMEALHDMELELSSRADSPWCSIEAVFTNVPTCTGARKAAERGIEVIALSSKRFFELMGTRPDDDSMRDAYDAAALALIEVRLVPDLIVLAGYRRRLGRLAHERYRNRIVNLYPGDTTKPYLVRGVDPWIQALRAGERDIRATVFFSRWDRRFGPAIAQSPPIALEGCTEAEADRLAGRIRREAEHVVLPFTVHRLIAAGRVEGGEDDVVRIDGRPVPEGGYQMSPDER